MLKYRLIFGTLMTILFTAIVIFDGWLDGSLTFSVVDDKSVQGTILCILVALLVILAQLELSSLAAARDLKIFTPVTITGSILFATGWYWFQFIKIPAEVYLVSTGALSLFGVLFTQYLRCGTSGVLANCGVSCFSIMYFGLLSAFVPAVRIDFGIWPLLMFVFVIKAADIGAYTFGSLFGKHKFSPRISPGKTWEGMLGAVLFAVVTALLFAGICDIMRLEQAVIFGICFAFIGQLGDLAESMIKRDTGQKDSSNNVPGFGGLLDVVDSPLAAAPFAYLFFMLSH